MMRLLFLLYSLSKLITSKNLTYTPSFDSYFLSIGYPSSDGTPWNDTSLYSYGIGDVNLDGYDDLVAFGRSNVYVALSNGTNFASPTIWSTSYSVASGFINTNRYQRHVVDLNGDKLADLLAYAPNGNIMVSLSNGTKFNGYTNWCGNCYLEWTYTSQFYKGCVDLNGDGRGDLVVIGYPAVYTIFSGGASFNSSGQLAITNEFGINPGWVDFETNPRFIADINGDGKADVYGYKKEEGVLKVGLMKSSGIALASTASWDSDFTYNDGFILQSLTPRYSKDLNGDKKDDIIAFASDGIYAEFSQGFFLGPKTLLYSYSDPHGSFLRKENSIPLFGDVNGDGKKDIVAITTTGDGIKVYLSDCLDVKVELQCTLCSSKNSSCSGCINRPVYLMNGNYSCPVGTYYDSQNFQCLSLTPFLKLTYTLNSQQSCQYAYVFAEIRQNESEYFPRVYYNWNVEGNVSDQTLLSLLRDNIIQQDSSLLQIPMVYIEVYANYTFTCSYLNAIKANITNRTNFMLVNTQNDLFPILNTWGDSILVDQRDVSNNLMVYFSPNLCANETYAMDYQWNQLSGPSIDPIYIYNRNPLRLPSCSLKQNTTVSFRVDVSLSGYPQYFVSKYYTLNITLDDFVPKINYADRSHPFNKPIQVKAEAIFVVTCDQASSSILLYTWTCFIGASPCIDSNNLFGTPSTSPSLSVPTTYFSENSVVALGLKIDYDKRSQHTIGYFLISGKNTLILNVYCTNPPCIKYNSNEDLYLQADIENDPKSGYSFNWTINFPFTTFQYLNRFFATGDITSLNGEVTIGVTIISGKYTGLANFTVPLNFPPTNGSLTISPSSGISFKTDFYLESLYWIDSDLPLSYTFYYQINNTVTPLTSKQNTYFAYTYLPGDMEGLSLNVIVDAQDLYGAISTRNASVVVYSLSTSLSESVSNLNAYLKTIQASDPQALSRCNDISTELLNFQNDLLELRENIVTCTGCGSENTCLNGTCICETPSHTYVDCSITQELLDQINSLDLSVAKTMLAAYKISSSMSDTLDDLLFLENTVLNAVRNMLENPELKSAEQLESLIKLLDSTILNQNNTLTPGQISMLADITSGIMTNIGEYDCNCSTAFCKSLANKTEEILNKMTADSLANKLPGQDPTIINTNSFDMMAMRTSVCDVSKYTFILSANSPTVILQPTESLDCKEIVDISYYNILNTSQVFDCGNFFPDKSKNNIMIKIVSSLTQKPLDSLFDVKVIMPPGYDCPTDCLKRPNGVCICQTDLFDVTAQLSLIFKTSSLSDLEKVDALSSWDWENSPIFWVNVGMIGWLGASLLAMKLSSSITSFCILTKVESLERLSKLKGILYSFCVVADFTNIYLVSQSDKSKGVRALMYYLRLILYSTFSAIFASSGVNESLLFLLENLQFYIILLPYWTVLPLNLIMSKLFFGKSINNKSKSTKTKIWRALIIIFLLVIIAGCIFAMFIIGANKSNSAQISWMVFFFFSFFQDIIIFPIIILLFQSILRCLLASKKSKFFKACLSSMIDQNLEKISIKTKRNRAKVFPETHNLVKTNTIRVQSLEEVDNLAGNNKNELHSDEYLDSLRAIAIHDKSRDKLIPKRNTGISSNSLKTLQAMQVKRKMFQPSQIINE